MTKLGEYLDKKSATKATIARKTGITKQRLNELTLKESAKLRADELYLIALAIDVNAGDMLEAIFSELREKVGK